MHTCPKCGRKSEETICPECGYNFSETDAAYAALLTSDNETNKTQTETFHAKQNKVLSRLKLYKGLCIAALALACVLCVILVVVTNVGESVSGTYYRYESVMDNVIYNTDDYYKLEKDGTWTNGSGRSGDYELQDNRISIYVISYGNRSLVTAGTINDGVMNIFADGAPVTYCKFGKGHIHEYSDWQTTKAPTCHEEGERAKICICGQKKQVEVIPAIHHSMKDNNAECENCGIKLAEYLAFQLNDNTYSLTDGAPIEGIITVPAHYNGKNVTAIGEAAFKNCESIINILLPDGITEIAYDAFYGCSNLTTINIPDGVTSIGNHAFYNCNSLTEINIPNGITAIETSVFDGCRSLTSITIPDSVTEINLYAFFNCGGITDLVIPDNVTFIGGSAFSGCSGLKTLIISDSVTEIGSEAFNDCSALASITIPDSVNKIGNSAFNGCNNIEYASLPELAIYYIPKSNLKKVIVTSGKYIGYSAFDGCTLLKDITLPDSIESFANYAFYGCSSIKKIEIPDSVTRIGGGAFYGCSSIEKIAIPDSVTHIGDSAFYGCSSLRAIEIGKGLEAIRYLAFGGCDALESITVSEDNRYFSSQDGILYNKYKTEFEHVPKAIKGPVTIPYGITSVGYAFILCSDLTSITLPNSITSIGSQAFLDCSSLTNVILGDRLTSIDNHAFFGCSSLTSITIPGSVKSIGTQTFNYSGLQNVYYKGTAAQWAEISIGGNSGLDNATIFYFSEEYPFTDGVTSGNFWHYADGEVVVWVKKD